MPRSSACIFSAHTVNFGISSALIFVNLNRASCNCIGVDELLAVPIKGDRPLAVLTGSASAYFLDDMIASTVLGGVERDDDASNCEESLKVTGVDAAKSSVVSTVVDRPLGKVKVKL